MREITNNIDREIINGSKNKFIENCFHKDFTDKIIYYHNITCLVQVLYTSIHDYFKVVTNNFVVLLLCFA